MKCEKCERQLERVRRWRAAHPDYERSDWRKAYKLAHYLKTHPKKIVLPTENQDLPTTKIV